MTPIRPKVVAVGTEHWLAEHRGARDRLAGINAEVLRLRAMAMRLRRERRWGEVGFVERRMKLLDLPWKAALAAVAVAEHQLMRRFVKWDETTGEATQFGRVVA